jgi:cystathionine beta-lyase/cystathionine gamma-synthase
VKKWFQVFASKCNLYHYTERREQEARANVEKNLAALQSLAAAVAHASGAAASARASAAAAEQLAMTNAAAVARTRANAAESTVGLCTS